MANYKSAKRMGFINKIKMSELLSIKDYINNLSDFEKHPLGQTQFQNIDFDWYPLNAPLGYFIESEPKHCIIMAGSKFNIRLYRGENKDNPNFAPTIKRDDLPEGSPEHCYEWIKTEEFKQFFKESIYYSSITDLEVFGHNFEPDIYAIAQHYGFKTHYLDLTQSRLVAMFFAMTYYDKKTKRYYPIKDFSKFKPTIYDIKITDLYKLSPNAFKIIGIQPLLRPLMQYAYAIDTSIFKQDLKQYFNKIELKPDPAGAEYVYDKFEGGSLLFPEERIQNTVDTIRNYNVNNKPFIKESLLFEYCKQFKLNFNTYKRKMAKLYKISDNKKYILGTKETAIIENMIKEQIVSLIKQKVVPYEKIEL